MGSTSPKPPLSIQGLSCLFSHPAKFFSGTFELKHTLSLVVFYLIWANSGSSLLDDFDRGYLSDTLSDDVLKSYLNPKTAEWGFGVFQTLIRSFSGAFVFGWCFFWFYIKAYICGFRANKTLNIGTLAAVYLYAELIFRLPIFVHRVLQSLVYSDPTMAALDTQPILFSTCCLVLNILSCLVGYQAMLTVFNLSGTRVRFFFKNMPIFFYIIGWLGMIA